MRCMPNRCIVAAVAPLLTLAATGVPFGALAGESRPVTSAAPAPRSVASMPNLGPSYDFSTYLGGGGRLGDLASDVAVDATGNVYVVGATVSNDFPVIAPWQGTKRGGFDVFVAKFAPTGELLVSTFLGGMGDDYAHAIAVDGAGNVYVTGETQSFDFPVMSALQPKTGGITCTTERELCGDAFVAKLSANRLRLLSSTYLGGRAGDIGTGISVAVGPAGASGGVVVTGATRSRDFPLHQALQPGLAGGTDAFVALFDRDVSMLAFSTFHGGTADERATDVAVAPDGTAFVTGWTESSDFPTHEPLQAMLGGSSDAFVIALQLEDLDLRFSTFLGGSGDDRSFAIDLDGDTTAFIAGTTDSADLPLRDALQPDLAGRTDAFLIGLGAAAGEQVYGSYLGGALAEEARDVAVDRGGNVYIAGQTLSTDFPVGKALQDHHAGPVYPDAFVSYLERGGGRWLFSSYLGGSRVDSAEGIAVDGQGNAHVVGFTRSEDFPTVRAAQPSNAGGNFDAFLTRITGLGGSVGRPTAPLPTATAGPSPTPVPTSTACAGEPPLVDPLTSPTDKTSQTITGTGRRLTGAGGEHAIRLCSADGCFYASTREDEVWEVEVALSPNRVNEFTAYQSSRACSHVASTRVDYEGRLLDIENRRAAPAVIHLPVTLK